MKTFVTFTKKEFLEQWRNYKIIILFAVQLLFGMMSPLLAKLTPELFSQIDMQGINIVIPTPTFLDAYTQYFKNMTQMCLIILVLVFSGNITHDLQKGTAVILFSKGLSRPTFLLSKFIATVIIWTVGYTFSAAVCYGYTEYLFPSQSPKQLWFSLFCFWLFVIFTLAVITLMGVIAKGSYAPMLLTAGVLIFLLILSTFPKITKYSPIALASYQMDFISGAKTTSDALPSLFITLGLIAICIYAAITIFKKRQL
jgi:ABC-2 type transport system permease protein